MQFKNANLIVYLMLCVRIFLLMVLGTGCIIQLTVQLAMLVCVILGYGMLGRTYSLGAQP